MALNTSPDRFGGARNPLQPGGIYIGKVIREHGDGTVTVFIKILGSKIGPIKVVNYTPSSVPNVGEQVIVSFLDNMLNDMVVIGRVTPRVDQLSIADNLIVDSSTTDTLVRFTQRGTGDVLRVEDSTNPDSTPLIVTADGSVGIGLTSPSKKLHVSGDAQITGDFTVGTSTLFFDVSEDSLGIGTITPAAKLHVTGSTSGELVRITQTGAGAALLVEDATNPDSTPFIVDTSGNVGIGVSSPTAKIDVSGAAVISGDLTVDTSTLKVDSSNNRVGIGTASPSVTLDISGATSISGDLTVDTTTLKVDSSNNRVGIGTASPSVTLDISGAASISGNLTVDTNTLVVDSTNNRIGINVTSPAFPLDVIGRADFRAGATQDGIAIVGRGGGTSSYDVTLTPTTLSADRTLTLPNVSGTVITTGDTGTVTSTMIFDGTIVNGDINASAAIADTKLATISTAGKVSNSATTATSSNTGSTIVARDSSGNFTAGTITATTFSGGLASSNLTGQTGMWTSAGRPGATRLYRNDYDDQYNVQTYWTGSRWRLYGYYGSSGHADTHVGYADSAGSASTAGSSNATTFTGTYVRMSGNGAADPHTEQGLQSGVGGDGAGLALWASGVAPQLRVGAGNNTIYLRNSNDTAYVTIEGIISNVSSVHLKQDIETFPQIPKSIGAAVNDVELLTGLNIVRQLRPVTYKWKEDEHFLQLPASPRRALALARLNKIRASQGLGPYESDELRHDCSRDDCEGTADNPCQWTKNWEIGNIGFISQEVGAVIPQAAILNKDEEFTSIDSLAMTALAVAAIKELDAKVTSLMERIETLENK